MEYKFQLLIILLLISLTHGLVNSTDGEKPLNVNPGDIVKVIAPGSKGTVAGLPKIEAYIELLQLEANISENIYSSADLFYSNTDAFRADDFISALLDDNIKIIWCVRGGGGSIRLIPYLEENLPAKLNHKIFVGYSDITVLHLYLQKKYGWQTIQGPMLEAIATGVYERSSDSVTFLEDLIFERREKICFPAKKLTSSVNVTKIESTVVGGNNVLVELSIGTLWELNAEGRILFLEDVDETPYRIERSLDHMKQSGLFKGVVAVVFGDFARTDTDPNTNLTNSVLDRFAESVSFPVFRIRGIGHGAVNYPLPFLTSSEINIVDGVNYEFCVKNIQNFTSSKATDEVCVDCVQNSTCSNSVDLNSNFNFFTGLIVGSYLFLY